MKLIKWIFYGIIALLFCWIPLVYAVKNYRLMGVPFKEILGWEYSVWWKTVKEAMEWES